MDPELTGPGDAEGHQPHTRLVPADRLARRAASLRKPQVVTYKQRWEKAARARPLVPPAADPTGPRRVVFINNKGSASCRTVTRRGLVDLFSIPYRDVRFVDPTMPQPYPTAILIREKALVVNLERIRLVISPTRVVVLSVMHQLGDSRVDCAEAHDLACGFVADLQRRARGVKTLSKGVVGGPLQAPHTWHRRAAAGLRHRKRRWSSSSAGDSSSMDEELPFELRVLEGALAEAVRMLEEEADLLQERTLPAAEAMARQLTLRHLEEVRECKRELTSLAARLERLRSTLDDILEDDDDMADMYLTRRAEEALAEAEESSTASEAGGADQEGAEALLDGLAGAGEEDAADDTMLPADSHHLPHTRSAFASHAGTPLPHNSRSGRVAGGRLGQGSTGGVPEEVLEWMERQGSALEGLLGGVRLQGGAAAERQREIEGVENMLETYLMRVEHLASRMQQLKERIDDTEDLVNIDLDSRRNDIVLVNLIATSVSIVFAFVTSIAGVFGMNLKSGLEGSKTAFVVATVLSYLAGFLILWVLVLWYQRRGLTFVPDARILD